MAFQREESMKRSLLAATAALTLVTACNDSIGPGKSSALARGQSDNAAVLGSQLWAVVNANATLAHGSRVTGVTAVDAGYEVSFNRDVRGCAFIGTTNRAYSQAITIFTASGHQSKYGVYVEIKNQGGGIMTGPFNLFVACGPLRFAVVGYSANLVRASAGTSLTALGSGRYYVTFANSVQHCAYLATVGDPGHALVYSPAGVYTGSGPDTNTVYVETKNPGGGLQDGVPFHLALVCARTANSRFAVVRQDGAERRASSGTTSANLSIGNYTVSNNVDISACAAVATRGSVNTNVPYTPATVEITPGPNTSTIGVQVRQLLFFGGARINKAFHAAIIC
jgi:hypothetical protein